MKPKFKVGDKVTLNYSFSPFNGKLIGKITNVLHIECDFKTELSPYEYVIKSEPSFRKHVESLYGANNTKVPTPMTFAEGDLELWQNAIKRIADKVKKCIK